MDAPGSYSLAALGLTTALAAQAQTEIDDLEGMTAALIEARFQYGSGGTSCTAVVQTSADGTNWVDIARFDFTTASAAKVCNLSAALSKAVTAIAALASEGVTDGALGTKLRAVITSVGTYANTTLSVRAVVR